MTHQPDSRPRALRICHVTTAHIRQDVRIFAKECVSLAAAGHEVHLIVGDGVGDEQASGVAIHDIGPRPASRWRRMRGQVARAGTLVRSLAPQVVHVHDPELLPLGVRLARAGVVVIYDAHEDVPKQILSKPWIPPRLRPLVARAYGAYERRAVSALSGIVAATPHIQAHFGPFHPAVVCVNNYPFLDELATIGGRHPRPGRICYVGGITRIRGVAQLIRALPLVPGVTLTLCGPITGQDFERELRAEPGWAQVEYLGTVDRPTLQRVLAESCAGVVTYLPEPNHLDAQPTKLFEYMSAGVPVIASDFPYWRALVADRGAGLCVDPESPEAVAAAIGTILGDTARAAGMGRAGRAAVVERFNWGLEARTLLAFYAQLTNPGGLRRVA